MRVVRVMWVAVGLSLAACSNSGVAASTAAAPPTGSPIAAGVAAGRASVDTAITAVLASVRALTDISTSTPDGEALGDMRRAASQIETAGRALTPDPAGVPLRAVSDASHRILELSTAMTAATTCARRRPDGRTCVRALDRGARHARVDLVLRALAPWGSRPPGVVLEQLRALTGVPAPTA
jgi:hypothetical protein